MVGRRVTFGKRTPNPPSNEIYIAQTKDSEWIYLFFSDNVGKSPFPWTILWILRINLRARHLKIMLLNKVNWRSSKSTNNCCWSKNYDSTLYRSRTRVNSGGIMYASDIIKCKVSNQKVLYWEFTRMLHQIPSSAFVREVDFSALRFAAACHFSNRQFKRLATNRWGRRGVAHAPTKFQFT